MLYTSYKNTDAQDVTDWGELRQKIRYLLPIRVLPPGTKIVQHHFDPYRIRLESGEIG